MAHNVNANNPEEYQRALSKLQEIHELSIDVSSAEPSESPALQPSPPPQQVPAPPTIAIDDVIAGFKETNTRLGRLLYAPLIIFFTLLPVTACYLYLFTFIEPLARLDIAWVFFSFIALVLLCGYCLLIQARITVMRLRDSGKRQLWAILWFIPPFSAGLLAYLLFTPSQAFENRYGTPPKRGGKLTTLFHPLFLARES